MGHAPVNGKTLPIVLGLIFVVPGLGSLYKIGELILEWDWALQYAADHVDNLPMVFHAIFGISFLGLGALQLITGSRAVRRDWHRRSGQFTALAGMLAATSGIWMTLTHQELSTLPLFYARLIFGSLWFVFIALGVRAVIRRNIPKHRAFMIRAYAIAATAGILPFIYLPIFLIFGELPEIFDDGIQIVGWLVSLTVAEYLIRRKPRLEPTPNLQASVA